MLWNTVHTFTEFSVSEVSFQGQITPILKNGILCYSEKIVIIEIK